MGSTCSTRSLAEIPVPTRRARPPSAAASCGRRYRSCLDQEEFIHLRRTAAAFPAQRPLPPGIFGYIDGEAGIDLWFTSGATAHCAGAQAEAARLWAEAGWLNGRRGVANRWCSASTPPAAAWRQIAPRLADAPVRQDRHPARGALDRLQLLSGKAAARRSAVLYYLG